MRNSLRSASSKLETYPSSTTSGLSPTSILEDWSKVFRGRCSERSHHQCKLCLQPTQESILQVPTLRVHQRTLLPSGQDKNRTRVLLLLPRTRALQDSQRPLSLSQLPKPSASRVALICWPWPHSSQQRNHNLWRQHRQNQARRIGLDNRSLYDPLRLRSQYQTRLSHFPDPHRSKQHLTHGQNRFLKQTRWIRVFQYRKKFKISLVFLSFYRSLHLRAHIGQESHHSGPLRRSVKEKLKEKSQDQRRSQCSFAWRSRNSQVAIPQKRSKGLPKKCLHHRQRSLSCRTYSLSLSWQIHQRMATISWSPGHCRQRSLPHRRIR